MRYKLYTSRMQICLTDKQKEKIERASNKTQMTINQIIRNLIEEHC